VAGADPEGEVGERHEPETHLIPLMLDAVEGKRAALTVFGSDYATEDGTCVRDYVHVTDLAEAHVRGLRWLESGKGSRVFCLGTGTGYSVREVLDHARVVTNRAVPVVEGARRAGDAAALVCGSERARGRVGLGAGAGAGDDDPGCVALVAGRGLLKGRSPVLTTGRGTL
jgi:UDP-glucose 4-epimerase